MTPEHERLREEVARIIDPDGWEIRDRHHSEIDRMVLTARGKDNLRASANTYVTRSLAKADAILAIVIQAAEERAVKAEAERDEARSAGIPANAFLVRELARATLTKIKDHLGAAELQEAREQRAEQNPKAEGASVPPFLQRVANRPVEPLNTDWDGDEGREGRRGEEA